MFKKERKAIVKNSNRNNIYKGNGFPTWEKFMDDVFLNTMNQDTHKSTSPKNLKAGNQKENTTEREKANDFKRSNK